MRDIVKANSEKMIAEAIKCELKELILLVSKPTQIPKNNIPIHTAYLVEDKELSKAMSLKKKYTYLIAYGSRASFENKIIDFILPDLEEGKDHTHYRNSGMDQILAKIAKTKMKTILFDFSLLKGKHREQYLGRMLQNARLCKKYKVPYELVTFASNPLEMKTAKDLKAMMRIF